MRGLKSKINEVFRNSLSCEQHVLCLTETWLNSSVSSSELFCDSYNVYRRDRETTASNKQEGGGVLIAVDGTFRSSQRDSWSSGAEDLWVTIFPNGNNSRKLHICCVYIPPSNSLALNVFCSKLSDILTMNPGSDFVICGDFNLPNITWELDVVNRNCFPTGFSGVDSCLFVDTVSFCGLSQFNNFVNKSNNTLDLIFANNLNIFNLNLSMSPLVTEDDNHSTLEFDLGIELHSRRNYKLQNNVQSLNYSKADFDAINKNISEVEWEARFSGLSTEECTDIFYSFINDTIKRHVPPGKRKYCNFPSWYTIGTIKAIREKRKYHDRWKRFGNKLDYLTFKLLRGRSKYLINKDYSNYIEYCEKTIESDPRHFWQYVKSKRHN